MSNISVTDLLTGYTNHHHHHQPRLSFIVWFPRTVELLAYQHLAHLWLRPTREPWARVTGLWQLQLFAFAHQRASLLFRPQRYRICFERERESQELLADIVIIITTIIAIVAIFSLSLFIRDIAHLSFILSVLPVVHGCYKVVGIR